MNTNLRSQLVLVTLVVISFLTTVTARADNLLANGSFAGHKDSKPVQWSVRSNKQVVAVDSVEAAHPDVDQALRVDILNNGGSSYGQIAQSVSVRPHTVYRFAGDWRASTGQTAFFEIKLIKERKELQRLHLGWSERAWQRVVRHVNSGEADTIEVLCRYRQKTDYIGTVCWFTNVSLTEVSDSTEGEDSITAISAPIAPPAVKTPSFSFPDENPDLKIAAPGEDQYVTLAGAGSKSGTDWENARPATGVGLQDAWDAVGPGHTLYLGSGEYKDAVLQIRAGGSSPNNLKRLQGVDTGSGLPVFVGSLDMDNIRDGWQTMLVGTANTGFWEVDSLQFRNCSCAVKLYGGNVGVRFSNLDISRVREGFTLEGMTDSKGRFATRDVVISDCSLHIYTKRGVRIRDGVSDLRIERVSVDAGGKEWFREAFPIGFQVSSELNMPECRNITYTDCTASGNWHPDGKNYWNGDGFCAERRVRDITYLRCRAFDNTDGGWDDKSANPRLIDCVSLRNKRNYRFWSTPGPARLNNCVGAYAIDHRSGNPGIGLWLAAGSYARAENSTFYANGTAIRVEADGRPTRCELTKCIIAGNEGTELLVVERGGNVIKTDTVEGTIGDAKTDPQLLTPTPEWNAQGEAFNSRRFPKHGVDF